MIKKLFILLFIFVQNLCFAGDPFFYKYDENNGFKAKNVNDIAESKDGKIWLATNQGLWYFDGYKFTQFKSSDKVEYPLLSNEIAHIFIDSNQNLWIGYFQNGLSVWNLKSGKRKNFHNFISSKELNTNRVTGINGVNNKVYVFFHDSAWLEFNPINYKYDIIRPAVESGKNPLLYRQIIFSNQHKKYYLASSDGMFLYEPKTKKAISKAYFINGKPVWKIHNSINGLHLKGDCIWQNTWGGGFIKYNITNDSFEGCFQYNTKEQFSGVTNVIFNAQSYNEQEFIFTTPDFGIGVFNTVNHKYIFFEDPKKENITYTKHIFKDSKRNFWIATEKDLWHLVREFQNLRKTINLPKSPNSIMQRLNYNHFIIEHKGKILTGSIHGNGVYVYNKIYYKLEKIVKFPGLQKEETFRTLQAFEYNGQLFINSWSGLFTLNIENEQWERFKFNGNKELENSIFRCVKIKKNKLLLGFYKSKIGWYNLETKLGKVWTETDVKNERAAFSGSQIFELELDINENLVAVHDGGFTVINTKNSKIFQFSSLLDQKKSMYRNMGHILEDLNGFLWLSSSESGLLKIDPRQNYKLISQINGETGLSGNIINDLTIDKYGCIWGLQSNFIFRLQPTKNLVSLWNKDNGIELEPDDWGVIKTINDNIFYGRLNEIIVINQKNLTAQFNQKNQIYLNQVIFNGQNFNQYNCPKEVVLEYDKNSFFVKLGSQNVLLNKHNQFRYRLKSKQDWILLENDNEININNLAPGIYRFEVSYKNNLSNFWSNPQEFIKIKVKHPFYQQWWFILSLSLILGAISYYFHRSKLQKRTLQSQYEKKIDELKLEALRSQMNPHFLFNSLNSINYFIVKNEPEKASDYLKKFSKLIRNILNHSKNEKVSLQEEIDINKLYIEIEQMRFNDSFDFKFNNYTTKNIDDILVPSMLLQPFIENAIWHGLMHKTSNGILDITVCDGELNEQINISIYDNGVGREAAAKLKSKTAQTQKSYGSEITIDRIKHFNAIQNQIEIKYIIEDMFDLNNNSVGTKVNINIISKNG